MKKQTQTHHRLMRHQTLLKLFQNLKQPGVRRAFLDAAESLHLGRDICTLCHDINEGRHHFKGRLPRSALKKLAAARKMPAKRRNLLLAGQKGGFGRFLGALFKTIGRTLFRRRGVLKKVVKTVAKQALRSVPPPPPPPEENKEEKQA